MSKKEQRLIFIAKKNSQGMMQIDMSFYPPLSKSKEQFEALPMDRREMQNAIADLGRYALARLASARGVDEKGQSYPKHKIGEINGEV